MLVLIVALLLGVNPGDLLGSQAAGPQPTDGSTPFAQCRRGADVANDRECRFVAYTNSIQAYWSERMQGGYQEIEVQTFTSRVDTACGGATSDVGPFYCPADTTVYLDLSFFDQLTTQLGAQGGDAAEAYVFAHEFGHHIQNLKGTMRRVQGSGQGTGPTSPGVRLELQADCYAGTWFRYAVEDPDDPIAEVSQDDLNRASDAAEAVGDDRIQAKTQGQVTPESWTHGSAAQRKKWLARGFSSGNPDDCDTFARDAL